MKDEGEPITPDEFVLRLIWHAFFKDGDTPQISPKAFFPRPTETDGISVFREECLADPRDVLTVIAEAKRTKYGLVRLPVSALTQMGLAVEPSRIETVAGHAILPVLNVVALDQDPTGAKELQRLLAELASKSVVLKPTS